MNRTPRKSYSDANTVPVVYCYDGKVTEDGGTCAVPTPAIANSKGRLTAVSSTAATTKYTGFDALGRVTASTQKVGTQSFGLSYTYNLAGGLITQGYPSGLQASFGYDGSGRLNSVSSYASQIAYAPHGGATEMRLGNAKWEHTVYNPRLQPTNIGLGGQTDSNLFQLVFDYGTTGNNGNVLTQTVIVPGFLNQNQRYDYDPVNRLKTAAEGGSVYPPVCPDAATTWCEAYGYDQYGNRWVKDTGGFTQRAVTPVAQSWFDAANNRIVANGYDAAGNQTVAGGGTFVFDAENRMTSVTLSAPQSGTFTYVYDGDGRRVKKTVYGMNSVYVYNAAGQLAAEYRDGALFKEFIYAGGRMLAMVDPHQGTSYITTDHLGSTRVVTDASATVHSRHDYLPFGKEVPIDTGRAAVAGYGAAERVLQRFTGKELDPETGLDYFLARYYSGAQGRFTSPDDALLNDPSDPQGWNLYEYARNNPLAFIDPTGHVYCRAATGAEKEDGISQVCDVTDKQYGKETDRYKAQGYSYYSSNLDEADRSFETGKLKQVANDLLGLPTLGFYHPFEAANENERRGMRGQAISNSLAFFGLGVMSLPGESLAGGTLAGNTVFEIVRDFSGKVHAKNLPTEIPRGVSRAQLELAAQELRASIQLRHRQMVKLGDKGDHALRIAQEQRLLYRIEKILGLR